jgi:hypothetical protein
MIAHYLWLFPLLIILILAEALFMDELWAWLAQNHERLGLQKRHK